MPPLRLNRDRVGGRGMVPAIMRCGGVKTPPYAFCKKGEKGSGDAAAGAAGQRKADGHAAAAVGKGRVQVGAVAAGAGGLAAVTPAVRAGTGTAGPGGAGDGTVVVKTGRKGRSSDILTIIIVVMGFCSSCCAASYSLGDRNNNSNVITQIFCVGSNHVFVVLCKTRNCQCYR